MEKVADKKGSGNQVTPKFGPYLNLAVVFVGTLLVVSPISAVFFYRSQLDIPSISTSDAGAAIAVAFAMYSWLIAIAICLRRRNRWAPPLFFYYLFVSVIVGIILPFPCFAGIMLPIRDQWAIGTDKPFALICNGIILLTLGTYLMSANRVRAVFSSGSLDTNSLFKRGVFFLEEGKTETALESFNEAFNKASSNAWKAKILYNAAVCNARLGQSEIAIRNLKSALTLAPPLRGVLARDTDFASLGNDAEFNALVRETG